MHSIASHVASYIIEWALLVHPSMSSAPVADPVGNPSQVSLQGDGEPSSCVFRRADTAYDDAPWYWIGTIGGRLESVVATICPSS
jgi:hypothetical protein